MAVYTPVSEREAQSFLKKYGLGTLEKISPILEGWENSNFYLQTTQGKFVLTLIEKRTKEDDLPWLTGFINHLADHGFECPRIEASKEGEFFQCLNHRPALISEFLEGRNDFPMTAETCFLFGKAMAEMHEIGKGWKEARPNPLGIKSWGPLLENCKKKQASLKADDIDPEMRGLFIRLEKALLAILKGWKAADLLPKGHIHTDLFPDNIFMKIAPSGQYYLSGFIDFYFACTDLFVMDIAVAINAWCFLEQGGEPLFQPDLAKSFLTGYESIRPLEQCEKGFLPITCQGMALRFSLTRLWDWMNVSKDALVVPKSPLPFAKRLFFFQKNNPF